MKIDIKTSPAENVGGRKLGLVDLTVTVILTWSFTITVDGTSKHVHREQVLHGVARIN